MKVSNFHKANCKAQFPSAHVLLTPLAQGQNPVVELGASKDSGSNRRSRRLCVLYPGFPLNLFIWDENLYPGQCARLCQCL